MPYDEIIQRLIPWVEYHQNRYARELEAAVIPGCRWLDIGAGVQIHWGWVGTASRDLPSRASLVIGCDVETGHLARNQDIGAAVVADGSRLPFQSAAFDLVTANMVFEHLAEPERVFREVGRVLRPGGSFVFVTPNLRHPAVWFLSRFISSPARRFLGHWADKRHLEHVFETHYKANRKSDVARLACEAGFAVKMIEAFPSYPIFRRPTFLTRLESLLIRTQRTGWPRRFSSNLVGRLEKG